MATCQARLHCCLMPCCKKSARHGGAMAQAYARWHMSEGCIAVSCHCHMKSAWHSGTMAQARMKWHMLVWVALPSAATCIKSAWHSTTGFCVFGVGTCQAWLHRCCDNCLLSLLHDNMHGTETRGSMSWGCTSHEKLQLLLLSLLHKRCLAQRHDGTGLFGVAHVGRGCIAVCCH